MRLDDHKQVSGEDTTPRRLLEAAERLFAEHGFAGTSVRDITKAAGCNVAAVNYHFGSKERLYQELFSTRLDELREQRTAAVAAVLPQAEREQNVAQVLEAFARAFIRPLTDPQRGRWVMGMFMREMTDPRLDRRMLVEKLFDPVQIMMCDALTRCVKGLTQQQAVLCVHSLVAQLLHAVQAERLFGGKATGPAAVMMDTDRVIEHVVRFSEGGIVHRANEKHRGATRGRKRRIG
ncbi:MAG: CerR family C-terminal domain-containing protein [Phycisphaeraceae bacterium]